jgi:hypothetical protein
MPVGQKHNIGRYYKKNEYTSLIILNCIYEYSIQFKVISLSSRYSTINSLNHLTAKTCLKNYLNKAMKLLSFLENL